MDVGFRIRHQLLFRRYLRGYAGQFGWKYGIAATWIGIGNAILGSLLAWWVLGPRTREVTHRLGASTMPEFFGARYRSKGLRIAAAAIIFVFLIPYTASVYNGLSRLFGMAFGLPYEVCVIGMAVITCIYVVLGGYMATVMNDFIQGIVMLAGIVAVIVAVLANNGGFTEAITSLSLIPAEGSEMAGPFVSFFGRTCPTSLASSSSPAWAPGVCRRWCRSSTPSRAARPSSRAPSSPRCSPWWWREAATFWAGSGVCMAGRLR